MVRGKDYVGNLSEIQERFCHGKYKGGPAENIGTFDFDYSISFVSIYTIFTYDNN